ncbi:hypothetical protein ACS0TY_021061 [Phlomoides rotata]
MAYPSSNLEDKETEPRESKLDISQQLSAHGNILSLICFVNILNLWALKGVNLIDVNKWYKFGALASNCTVTPELEIKFISVASEDTINEIKYSSFHFMKLQRLDKKVFNYIKEQETKSALVVNLTEDEISTRRV